MLRPMLREWLDDNLPRIIENAVKDEIASSDKQKD
jgi:cell pole-organizing protein PopZ